MREDFDPTVERNRRPPGRLRKFARQILFGTRNLDYNDSDIEAVNDLFSEAGKRYYFKILPHTKGEKLTVRYAREDDPLSD